VRSGVLMVLVVPVVGRGLRGQGGVVAASASLLVLVRVVSMYWRHGLACGVVMMAVGMGRRVGPHVRLKLMRHGFQSLSTVLVVVLYR